MNFLSKHKQCFITLFCFIFVLGSGIGLGYVASAEKHAVQSKPTLVQKQKDLIGKDQKQDLAALQNQALNGQKQALSGQNPSNHKKSNVSAKDATEIAKQRKLARLQERRARRAAQRAEELAYQNRMMQEIVRDQEYALMARDFDEYSRMHRAMYRMRHQDDLYRYQRRANQQRLRQQQIDRDRAMATQLQLLELAAAGLL